MYDDDYDFLTFEQRDEVDAERETAAATIWSDYPGRP